MVGRRPAGIDGGGSMTSEEQPRGDFRVRAVAFALGAVFIYAGVEKFRDSLQFADSIAAFALVPPAFINLLALGLPPFEIVCGLLLLTPWMRRIGVLAIALSAAIFFAALLSALLRGLTLDCGCFGAGAPSRTRMWIELGVDAILICASLYVYFRSPNSPDWLHARPSSAARRTLTANPGNRIEPTPEAKFSSTSAQDREDGD